MLHPDPQSILMENKENRPQIPTPQIWLKSFQIKPLKDCTNNLILKKRQAARTHQPPTNFQSAARTHQPPTNFQSMQLGLHNLNTTSG